VLVVILAAAVVLGQFGASFGEALYVSMSGVIVLSYAVMSWQLQRGK
jgi:hypothetical protein